MRHVVFPDFVGSVESRRMHNVGQKVINLTVGGHGHRVRSAKILERSGIRTFKILEGYNRIFQRTASVAIENKRMAGLGGEVGEESRSRNADRLMSLMVGPHMILENKYLVVDGIPMNIFRIHTGINLTQKILRFLNKGEIRIKKIVRPC